MKPTVETAPVRRYSRLQLILKGAERLFKHGMLAVLTRVAAPRPEGAPDWQGGKLRVLFLRHDRIGDMILSTAVIHAIAQSHPNIELDVLASPLNAAVLDKDPLVRRVLRFDVHRLRDWRALLRETRKTPYDIVVDCMVFKQSFTTMLLMLATRAPHRVGVLKPGKPNVYTLFEELAGPDAHHVEHLAQLAVPFGVAPQDALRLDIFLSEEERAAAMGRWNSGRAPRVLVNISVGRAFRQWPDANFASVAQHLKARLPGARVMILHAPAERERAQAIADAAGVERAQTPGVRDALAMVATADFIFTPDTSILHAASAFHIPTVAIVTSDHLVRWGLYGTIGEMVVAADDTLATVPLEQAMLAIEKVLAKGSCASDDPACDNIASHTPETTKPGDLSAA